MPGKLWQRNITGAKERGRQNVARKLKEMCDDQGVQPEDTLTEADVRKFMVLSHAEKNMITLIATGFPVRNAQAILRALDMKLDRSAPKAAPQGADKAISVVVNTIGTPSVTTMTLPDEPQDEEEKEDAQH